MASNCVIEEFDCVVCTYQLKHPKFIGKCNHTFCKKCITKYWISLGRERTIPCPQCREQCQIPPNGADGLSDNFHVTSIIEKYNQQQDKEQQDMCHRMFKCFRCSEVALSFCKDCDVNICPECKGKHSRDLATRHHDLFSLCLSHGKGLQLFCVPCKVGVCGGCRLSAHDGSDHHVIPLRSAVDDIVSTISNTEIETIISTKDVEITLLEPLELHIAILKSNQMKMKTTFEQWQAATSGESILGADCVANLSSISQQLKDLVTVSKESDTKTLVKEVKKSICEHPGHPRLRPRPFIGIADKNSRALGIEGKFKKIKTLKKVRSVTFPTDRKCVSVRKIVNLSDGRFSILGDFQGSASGLGDTVYTMNINDKTSPPIHNIIEKEVDSATDMAVISTGELVVTRWVKPLIRTFHPDTKAYRDINITHDGEVIEDLWSVETDDDDNMFVTTGLTGEHGQLLAVNPTGDIIQRIQLDAHYGMAFSKVNRILNVAAEDRLLRFHWSQNTLKEISSSQHGVEGFSCKGVCIGSRGDVLVAGFLKKGATAIYQVKDKGDSGEMVWRRIPFKDNVERKSKPVYLGPFVCCEGDQLWLGYEDKVELFQMQ